tara:strand:+ start:2509 stop:4953 length:2445 start_codon:yes stop_codon:yes gene_type:complete
LAQETLILRIASSEAERKLKKLEKEMKAFDNAAKRAQGTLPGVNNAIRKTGGIANRSATSVGKLGKSFKGLAASGLKILGPLVAVTAAIGTVSKSFKVMGERERDIKVLRNGLAGMVTDADMAARVLEKSADRLGNQTLFSEDQFNKGFKLLTSFKSIAVSSYDRIAQAAADVAEVSGTDVTQAFMQLAKAIDLPEKNLANLSRSGIIFSDAQKDIILGLKKSGDALGAQSKILEIIESQYAGAAVAAGKGFAGAVDLLKEEFTDFQEILGKELAPAFEPLVRGLASFIGNETVVKTLANAFKTIIFPLNVITRLIQGIGEGLNTLSPGLVSNLSDAFEKLNLAVSKGFVFADKFLVIIGKLLGSLPAVFSPAIKKISELWIAMFSVASEVAEKIANIYKSVTEKITNFFGEAFDNLKKRITEFYESLPGWMKKALEFMGGGVKNLTDKVSSAVSKGVDNAKSGLDVVVNASIDTSALDDVLTEASVDKAKAISEYLASPKATDNSLDKITDRVKKDIEEINKKKDIAKEKAEKLAQLYKQIGDEIKSGVVDGIKSAISGAKTFGEVLSNVLNRISDKLLNFAVDGIFSALGSQGGFWGKLFGGGKIGAGGLYADRPTQAIIGHGKEYVLREDQLAGALDRFSKGQRGQSVIPMSSSNKQNELLTKLIVPEKSFASGGYVNQKPVLSQFGDAGKEVILKEEDLLAVMSKYRSGGQKEKSNDDKKLETSLAKYSGNSQMNEDSNSIARSGGMRSNEPINVSYNGPTLNFNGDEYVPRSSVPEIINAAARQGAKAGEARMMSSLKNNRSTRASVGL